MVAGGGCLPEGSGLPTYEVVANGAAARDGLKAVDVITHINAKKTGSNPSEFASVFGVPAAIEFRMLRDDKSLSVTVIPQKDAGGEKTERRSVPACASPPSRTSGVKVRPGHDTGASLISLADSIDPLKRHFNANREKTRVLALLSPT